MGEDSGQQFYGPTGHAERLISVFVIHEQADLVPPMPRKVILEVSQRLDRRRDVRLIWLYLIDCAQRHRRAPSSMFYRNIRSIRIKRNWVVGATGQ